MSKEFDFDIFNSRWVDVKEEVVKMCCDAYSEGIKASTTVAVDTKVLNEIIDKLENVCLHHGIKIAHRLEHETKEKFLIFSITNLITRLDQYLETKE